MVDGAVAAALALFTPGCGFEKLASTTPTRSTIEFVVTSDSLVILGGTLPIIVKGSLSSLPATARILWSTSDAKVATVDETGKVKGVGIGLVRISARLFTPDLDTGIVRSLGFRVKYRGIAIAPIDSLTGLGQTVTPLVQGLDTTNVVRGTVAATLSSSQPGVVAAGTTTLIAVKNGSATITATFDAATADVSVKVRQVAKSVSFGSAPFVFRALERDTTVVVTVRDVLDNIMVVTPIWSAVNAAAASVTREGVLRAHQATATQFRVSVDTVTATLPVSVSQVIATVTKVAGDAQSQTAGSAVSVAPAVSVKDAGGAGIPGVPITFSVLTGGGALTTGSTTTSAAGVATLGSWTLGTLAGANSLSAVGGGVTQTFTATGIPGAPARVRFTSSPAGTLANLTGTALAPAVSANVLDANGNVATLASTTVSLALVGPAGDAPLDGTTSIATVAGVAAYGALKASAPSASYRLVASAGGLLPDTTAAFTVLGAPAKLAFVAQPVTAASSATLPRVTVAVQDAAGSTLSAASNSVSLTIGTNPGGASLSGGATTSPVAGVASFAGLSLNKSGTGYSLIATAAGLTSAISSAFNIAATGASTLSFVVAPASASNATVMTPAVQVAVTDADGNIVTGATGTIVATIESGTGGALASSTATITNGVATFAGLALNGLVGVYTLRFSDGTRSVISRAVALSAGAASALAIGTPLPTTSLAGQALVRQPVIKVVDASGNTVTSATGTMTATIASGSNGSLTGATTPIVGGTATFATLTLSGPAAPFAISFGDGTRSVTSSAVMLTNPAAVVIVPTLSATATNGAILAVQPVVKVVDDSGATVTSATGTMTASIIAGTGAVLLNATTPLIAGVATFSALELRGPAGVFTLRFSDGTRTVNSLTVTLGVGPASALGLTTAPSAAAASGAAFAQQPVVKVVDVGGNTVSTAGTMRATITGGSGAVLSSATAPITAGVATFSGLALTGAPGDYSMQFSDGSRNVISGTITLGSGAANAMVFTTGPPASATDGIAFGAQPVIRLVDAQNNTVASATGTITATIASGTGAILASASAPITAGVATFSGLRLTGTVGIFTLKFSDGTRTITSGPITLGLGPASAIRISTAPSATGANGVVLATQPVVSVRDVGGNVVTSASGTMMATIASGSGSTLTGATATIADGVATFSGLTFSGTAGDFIVQFSDGTRTTTSGTISVSPGDAVSIAFVPGTVPTAAATNGLPLPVQPRVRVLDASGNIVTSATGTMTASIFVGSGGTLLNATTAITAGVATFTTLGLSGTPGEFTLRFSDGTRTLSSSPITLGVGAASAVVIAGAPSGTATNGDALASQPVVTVVDAVGNVVTGATGTMTATINSGAAGVLTNATAPITAGVATFSGLTLNGPVGNFTLQFSDGSRSIGSGPIALASGAQKSIVFTVTSLAAARNGIPFTTQPSVRIIDVGGNTVDVSGTVTATVATGSGALVNNTATLTAGVATFTALTLTGTAGPFTLTLTNGTVSATTGTVLLSAGPASGLNLTTPPPAVATDDVVFSPQPVVRVVDADNNTVVDATGTIMANIATGTGALLANATAPITAGVATFSGMRLTGATGTFTLHFVEGSRYVTSDDITLVAGAATSLQLTDESPSSGTNGVPLSTQPIVTVRDVGGNVVTSASGTMTATIASGPASTLTGATATIVRGVATFSGLTFTGSAGDFTVQFSDGTRATTSGTIAIKP